MTELSPEELALLQPEPGAADAADAPREAGGPRRRGGRAGHAGTGPGRLPAAAALGAAASPLRTDRGGLGGRAGVDPLASLEVLERLGMDILDPRRGTCCRPPVPRSSRRARGSASTADWSLERIRTAPSQFTLHAWNPAHDLRIGGDWMAFGSVGSAAQRRRPRPRPAGRQQADYQDLIRLCQIARRRPLHRAAIRSSRSTSIRRSAISTPSTTLLTLADKPIHAYSLGRQRNLDAMEMARIARGIDEATLDREPSIFTVINSTRRCGSTCRCATGSSSSRPATRSS